MSSDKPFQIAIDGPVASGCSTIARIIAERLGFLYVDTGAMYRMTALLAQRNGIDPEDEAAVTSLVKQSKMDMRNPLEEEQDGRLITVLLDGEDVSWKIRTEEVSKYSSIVAQYPGVRQQLVAKQQTIADSQPVVVMEGRDITYKVLPDADLKIFMTASDIVRAKRRHLQEQTKGRDINFEEVYQELVDRDKRDMERETDPLKIVDDAWVIDTSDLSIQQVVDLVVSKVKAMKETKQPH
jgi:CMP/dCMP kinase